MCYTHLCSYATVTVMHQLISILFLYVTDSCLSHAYLLRSFDVNLPYVFGISLQSFPLQYGNYFFWLGSP